MGRPKGALGDDTERRELYEQGLSDKEIAKLTGYEYESIWWWRKRRGLPRNNLVTT